MYVNNVNNTSAISSTANSLSLAIPKRENWETGFNYLCEFLSDKLQRIVNLIVVSDFEEVQKLIQQRKADFGIFTSTSYVKTKDLYNGLKYIATGQTIEGGNSRSYYPGLFIVNSNNEYKSLADLKGKPFAFVSSSSSSGYKYPVAFLNSHGIDAKNYFGNIMFMGDHSYVTDAVATGIASGGVTWDVSLSKATEKHGEVFQTIGKYGPVVNHAFAVGEWIDEPICKILADSLTTLPNEVINTFGFPYSGFEILSDSAYDMARKVDKNEHVSSASKGHSIQRSLTLEEFCNELLSRILYDLKELHLLEENKLNNKFIKREITPLITHNTNSEFVNLIRQQLDKMVSDFPNLDKLAVSIHQSLEVIFAENSQSNKILAAFQSIWKIFDEWRGVSYREETEEFNITAEPDKIIYNVKSDLIQEKSHLDEALSDHLKNISFITLVTSLNERLREKRLRPTPNEQGSIHAAYLMLHKGATVRAPYKSLGISGFRKIHTLLFNTNPGEGHISVTCKDLRLMKGAPVHVEHIDRDKEFDKEKIEPYRIPAISNAANVRLHVGSHTPCTCYIGRPVFENSIFELDLLKTVHMISSACTAMFMNGFADCKIAMERMTVTEAIKFMRCLVGNVIRDSNTQYLSAAFNINTPIVDDRPETIERHGAPVELRSRMEIARIAIEIAEKGRFERVTWDGASNDVPSIPITKQFSHEQLTMLVHEAHKKGLQTYISAGLKPVNMHDAVVAGIDGVGMGTSLHYIDAKTKLMGALKPEAIIEALRIRDEAEASIEGKAAILLARLDRLFFEGSLQEEDDSCRLSLYEAVMARNVQQAAKIIDKLQHIMNMPAR
jgi:phosphate/phosphite/phosphonate ABC transporter binding protein